MSASAAPERPAVTLADLSQRARFGCKGPAAEAFLSSLQLPLPASPNAWTLDDAGRFVARLATSEFLVEASGFEQDRVTDIAAQLYDPEQRRPGLVPVPRQDLVVELAGPRANDVLRQTCNVNFAALTSAVTRGAGALVLTMMIGVGVTVVPRVGPHGASLTIWTDPSFSHYLWSMLADITKGLGGGILASWGDGREAP
jgi:heterotetrameric sarcosine oxidase gamma subunit